MEKFISFKDRTISEGELLQQETKKYISQLDFEIKKTLEIDPHFKHVNLNFHTFQKHFGLIEKSMLVMLEEVKKQLK